LCHQAVDLGPLPLISRVIAPRASGNRRSTSSPEQVLLVEWWQMWKPPG